MSNVDTVLTAKELFANSSMRGYAAMLAIRALIIKFEETSSNLSDEYIASRDAMFAAPTRASVLACAVHCGNAAVLRALYVIGEYDENGE